MLDLKSKQKRNTIVDNIGNAVDWSTVHWQAFAWTHLVNNEEKWAFVVNYVTFTL
jgi:hypothetical protein